MSVSDPLIKELKGYARVLTERFSDITDDTPEVPELCRCLEKCFQRGVSTRTTPSGVQDFSEVWQWMEDITRRNDDFLLSYSTIVENVLENQKVQDTTGRIRLLIRTCLNRKCLDVPVGYLIRTPYLASDYYTINSILGHEILGEIFYSVLLQISRLNFKLDLRNASFLDYSWDLPICINVDFVPCKTLGISVCFEKSKALVVRVEKNSVASEDGTIELGDILDEINGKVISTHTKINLGKILKRTACLPISAYIVKFRNKEKNQIYSPIASIIKNCQFDYMKDLLSDSKPTHIDIQTLIPVSPEEENDVSLIDTKPGYLVDYCGSVKVGHEGDVKQIEKAIRRVLHTGNINFVPVRFECLELAIKISQDCDDKEILKLSYMDISSCGRSSNFPDHFAFIAGETNCSVALDFTAHVFFHKNDREVQIILESLGQGFYRTHFAV
ncbi:hypothetical protein TKK_0004568 [Trichogramma kaykai]|uniref:PDZ domain-containing protein n=1 Tax=Trichogramma kaykai TaxID=54128 RepID=A0ABD2XMP8_9HYME